MANYGVLYVFRFESANKTNIEIQILKKDYRGARTYRSLGRAPILKREKSGCVHGSSLELYAECQVDGEFASLYTSSADEYKVEVYKIDEFLGDTFQRRVWTGFVSPELYSEPDIAPPYDVQIIATDGLGELKNYVFEARGLHSVQDHLEYMLGHTGLSQEFNVLSLMAGDSGTVPIMDVTVSLDHMAGESCYDVLKAVLDSFHAEIACQVGYWMIWRETDLVNLTSQVEVAEFGSKSKADWWPVGQLSTVIEPAKKRVTVISEDAYKDNVLKDMPYHADGATYDSDEKAFILPTAGTSVLKTLRFGAEVGYKLLLTVTARNVGSGDEGQPIGIKVKIGGRSYMVGDTFWLREKTDGKTAWSNADGSVEKMLEAPSVSDSAKDAQTIALELPLYNYSNRAYHYATSVEVTIFNIDGDYPIHVYDVTLSKLDQLKGYKSVLEIDNGAREEADEANLIIADDDRIPVEADIFMNGIALNASGEPISSWASVRLAAMGYLAFMSRDYALSVALPRMKVQGVLNVPDSAYVTPVLFLRDNTYYFPETYNYDLLNDELSVSLVSIPTAQIEVVSEEVTEVVDPFQSRPGGTAGGGSSSGGSSGGGGTSGGGSADIEGSEFIEVKDGKVSLIVDPQGGLGANQQGLGIVDIPESALGNVPSKTYVDDAARQAYNNAYNDSVYASTAYTDTAKQQLIASKAGAFYVEPSTNLFIVFTTEEMKAAYISSGDESGVLGKFALGGGGTSETSYRMTINGLQSSYGYTTSSETMPITCTFKSQVKYAGDDSYTDFAEDAVFTVSTFKNGGWVELASKIVSSGATFSLDLKPYMATGSNSLKVVATGIVSNASDTKATTVSVSSLSLTPFNFNWWSPFIEGKSYGLGGLKILGSLSKTLHIKVTGSGYSREYTDSIGTEQHDEIAYKFENLVHPSASGVYKVEIWLTADSADLQTEKLTYNIMCIASEDVSSAKLICLNEVATELQNYTENKLFAYAVYNGGALNASPSFTVVADGKTVASGELSVNTGVANTYSTSFAIASSASSIPVTATAVYGNTITKTFTLDNEASFAPVSGYSFLMDAATRNNTDAYRNYFINEVNQEKIYTAWTDMAWVDGMDGWTTDSEGNKCLLIPAMSKANVNLTPMKGVSTFALEMLYKAENVADFDEDIITIATNTASSWMGLKIKPTNICLHSQTLGVDDLRQSYNTQEDTLVHLMVTVITEADNGIGNIAIIYVNGVKKCSFEWSAGDTFAHNGELKLGSDTADLYLYKMRMYNVAFSWPQVMQNYISSLHTISERVNVNRKEESVLDDSNRISYDKVYGVYNTFVIRLPKGASLPNAITNPSNEPVEGANLYIDIVQNRNCSIQGEWLNVPIEGQGTTAMTYYRWNIRSKTSSAYDKFRITAKKNVASSMQSHKRGATALYNDLNLAIVGANEANGRVAVYQYPVYGFLEVENEDAPGTYHYDFIGLYTIGPDKGDKSTFGYDNEAYEDTLIHMEGTDHSPRGVGMDYPWEQMTVGINDDGDAFIGPKNSSGGLAEEAWEIGACGSYEDASAMKTYLDAEFAPAYTLDYECTPLIVGLPSGTSISTVNANVASFRAESADYGFSKGDCLVYIEGEYDVYYFDVITEQYKKDGRKIYEGLSAYGFSTTALASASDKTSYIRQYRKLRYRAEVGNYWFLNDSLLHACFLDLIGATDNEKKNSYPYKFGTLASGSRWRWRQDDLDTIFDENNQGSADKKYSIMNTDKQGSTMIFKGNTSYHWRCIREYYKDEMKTMMQTIMDKMVTLCPASYGSSKIEKLVGCIRHYFWDYAQDYFTGGAYNADAKWTYEDTWVLWKQNSTINAVHPLQQSLGSHYEAEKAWVTLRMLFLASMNEWGAFVDYVDRSAGQVSFRQGGDFTFTLTPAIDMRPSVIQGANSKKIHASGRVLAGNGVAISTTADTSADTMVYIQGADWLQDIGDFSKAQIGSSSQDFAVTSKRLQKLKVGDSTASKVTTNIDGLTIGYCPSLMEIEARNVTTLVKEVNLSQCPRLRRAYFGGTQVPAITLADGSKVTALDLPSTIQRMTLRKLPLLRTSGLTYADLNNLTYLWVEDNAYLDGYDMLKAALEDGSPLNNIRVIGFTKTADADDTDFLLELASGDYHGITAAGAVDNTIAPVLVGTVNYDTIDEEVYNALHDAYGNNLEINYNKLVAFIKFADDEVKRVLIANGVDTNNDGGIEKSEVEAVTGIGEWFYNNTVISFFNEFTYFTGVTSLGYRAFQGCTSLQEIALPTECTTLADGSANYGSFRDCSSLRKVVADGLTSLGYGAFQNCSALSDLRIAWANVTKINTQALRGCTALSFDYLNLVSLETFGTNALNGVKVKKLNLGKVMVLPGAASSSVNYGDKSVLEEVVIPEGVTSIPASSFQDYSALQVINIPLGVVSIGNSAFYRCALLKSLDFGEALTTLGASVFGSCTSLESLIFRATTPPTIGNNLAFNTNNCPIYVPDASVEAYKAATNWSTYASRIKPLSEYNG